MRLMAKESNGRRLTFMSHTTSRTSRTSSSRQSYDDTRRPSSDTNWPDTHRIQRIAQYEEAFKACVKEPAPLLPWIHRVKARGLPQPMLQGYRPPLPRSPEPSQSSYRPANLTSSLSTLVRRSLSTARSATTSPFIPGPRLGASSATSPASPAFQPKPSASRLLTSLNRRWMQFKAAPPSPLSSSASSALKRSSSPPEAMRSPASILPSPPPSPIRPTSMLVNPSRHRPAHPPSPTRKLPIERPQRNPKRASGMARPASAAPSCPTNMDVSRQLPTAWSSPKRPNRLDHRHRRVGIIDTGLSTALFMPDATMNTVTPA